MPQTSLVDMVPGMVVQGYTNGFPRYPRLVTANVEIPATTKWRVYFADGSTIDYDNTQAPATDKTHEVLSQL